MLKTTHSNARHRDYSLSIHRRITDHSTDMKKVLPAILLLGLSGCASFHWEKADADQATLDRDIGECRRLARTGNLNYFAQPPGEPFTGGTAMSPYIGMKASSANYWQYSSSEAGVYAREDRLLSTCMRHRGYDRVQEGQQKA
jgi:hypothetical protein